MREVLASLKPYYYYLVGEGIKEVEVRKSIPKSNDWDKKVFFYMSKDEKSFAKIPKEYQEKYRRHFGKVGLQFVCDKVAGEGETIRGRACLDYAEQRKYAKGKALYYWHITDLKIYDKPKELSEFFHYCGDNPKCDGCEAHYYSNTECGKEDYCCSIIDGCKALKSPPQSWFYVEEISK